MPRQVNKLQEDYTKLIWSIVNKVLSQTKNKYYYTGLEEDLFQEGYIGLLVAQKKYKEGYYDAKPSTFFYKYIYGYILNFFKKNLTVANPCGSRVLDMIKSEFYEMDIYFKPSIINDLEERLKKIGKKLPENEKSILENRLIDEYTLEKCATLNNCSRKKVTNTIEKYKSLMKDILENY